MAKNTQQKYLNNFINKLIDKKIYIKVNYLPNISDFIYFCILFCYSDFSMTKIDHFLMFKVSLSKINKGKNFLKKIRVK
ncbi:hypothetical protein Mgra_00005735 [Meloidogyne graminicola]|uniref:Uncharacterized protein n=1 Tax=Meloidogyne graminicola TaxID=189291 RepID=A0A8S9ZNG7_9BILA|nr:hypothetical protein Mgra_00005735 [Meloidogyne graminicola]